jgi:hypothetical protein
MLLTILFAAAPAMQAPATPVCHRIAVEHAKSVLRPADSPNGARQLGELPPGGLHLTVVRTDGGCIVPTLVKDGYGGPAHR